VIKIFKKEDGAVLMISIIMISVLLVLVTALAGSINSNISFTKRNENNIKAFYTAEAGIEKGINLLINSRDQVDNAIDQNDNYNFNSNNDSVWENNNKYNIEIIRDESNEDIYYIFSDGISNNLNKKIDIKALLINAIGGGTIIAGGDIDQYEDAPGNNFEVSIDSLFPNIPDVPDLKLEELELNSYTDFGVYNEEYNNGDRVYNSDPNQKIIIDAKNGIGSYVQNDITINDTIIVVSKGDVLLDNVKGDINNLVIIAEGKIDIQISNANNDFNNVFFYSAYKSNSDDENIDPAILVRDKINGNGHGAITTAPNNEIKGQMLTTGDALFYMKKGNNNKSGISYQNVPLPEEFKEISDYLQKNNNQDKKVELSNWNEE
jgi:hypothetical protein